METPALILMFASWWLYVGAAVALLFLTVGIDRIDEDARGSYVFRPLLVPGILLIWPLVLWRWLALERKTDNMHARYKPVRAAHKPTWLMLAFILPLLFIAALVVKQRWPSNAPAIQLEAPMGTAEQ